MKKDFKVKPLCAAIGATFAVSMAVSPVANAADNPFELNAFDSGYMVADSHEKKAEGKCGEGKCGEGKCGGKKEGDDPCAKKAEGTCGEGKCGGKTEEGGSMTDKAKEAVEDAVDSVNPLSP